MSSSVTLLFDWTYKAYGKNHNKCIDYPVTISGRSKKTVFYDTTRPLEEQIKSIKKELVESVKKSNHDEVKNVWGYDYGYYDEEIASESVKLFHVREATKWSDLDDY